MVQLPESPLRPMMEYRTLVTSLSHPSDCRPAPGEYSLVGQDVSPGGYKLPVRGIFVALWCFVVVFGSVVTLNLEFPRRLGGIGWQSKPTRCNPYEQVGTLAFDLEIASGNKWEPLDASCIALDYLAMIATNRATSLRYGNDSNLDFMRNKTVLVLGDSVDRNNVDSLCIWIDGSMEIIGPSHPLSPPQVILSSDDVLDHATTYTGTERSHPRVCTLPSLDFTLVFVFTFGMRGSDDWLRLGKQHFYPPARWEDRFEHIAKPLLQGLARREGRTTILEPDLLSITSGFWDVLRRTSEDNILAQHLANLSHPSSTSIPQLSPFHGPDDRYFPAFHPPSSMSDLSPWTSTSMEERYFMGRRIEEVIEHVLNDAGIGQGSIIWRTLHQPVFDHNVPPQRVRTNDAMGRFIVETLIRKARRSHESEMSRLWSHGRAQKSGRERLRRERLILSEWGSMILGQENHFLDMVHPRPLPAGYLHGNMLLEELRRSVD